MTTWAMDDLMRYIDDCTDWTTSYFGCPICGEKIPDEPGRERANVARSDILDRCTIPVHLKVKHGIDISLAKQERKAEYKYVKMAESQQRNAADVKQDWERWMGKGGKRPRGKKR